MVAPRQLRCVEVFLQLILTRRSGKLYICSLLRRVSLILQIMHVNEVTDVCCMCKIFACLSSVGIVNVRDTFTCLGYSQFLILRVRHLQVSFHSVFTGSILAHSLICALPSSRLSIRTSNVNAHLLIFLRTTFKRAFNVLKFAIGVITFVC
jgi:hypothetical protein